MRKITLVAIVLSISVIVPPAHSSHRPNGYCSESGDVCLSTKKRNGVRRLSIGLGAKYFSRYRLCVDAPDESRECIKRRITDQGQTYGDSVNWSKHFPDGGAGEYDVMWRQGGNRLGKKLGFHE